MKMMSARIVGGMRAMHKAAARPPIFMAEILGQTNGSTGNLSLSGRLGWLPCAAEDHDWLFQRPASLYGESLVKPVLLGFLASADCAVDLLVSLFAGGDGPSRVYRRSRRALRALDGPSPPAFDHPRGRRRFRIPLGRPGRVRRKASEIAPRKAADRVRVSERRVASSVGWGLALAEGLALVTLYPDGSNGRATILHA
jgi:hypothetical protein